MNKPEPWTADRNIHLVDTATLWIDGNAHNFPARYLFELKQVAERHNATLAPSVTQQEKTQTLGEPDASTANVDSPRQKELEGLVHVYGQRLDGIHSCFVGRYPFIVTIDDGLSAAAWERDTLRNALASILACSCARCVECRDIAGEALENARYAMERHIEEVMKGRLSSHGGSSTGSGSQKTELDATIRYQDHRQALDLLREAHQRMGNTAFPSLAVRIATFLATAPPSSPSVSVSDETKAHVRQDSNICPFCGEVIYVCCRRHANGEKSHSLGPLEKTEAASDSGEA